MVVAPKWVHDLSTSAAKRRRRQEAPAPFSFQSLRRRDLSPLAEPDAQRGQ
jgi:hypothetical protein